MIRKRITNGFTIAELLVIIAAVAILTTIITVSYRGITNNANDMAIQHDLREFSDKISLSAFVHGKDEWRNEEGSVTGEALEALNWSASRDAYDVSNELNLPFCYNREVSYKGDASWATPSAGRKNWALVALSKSGNIYYVSSEQSIPTRYKGSVQMQFNDSEGVCGIVIQELGAEGFGGLYHGYNKSDTSSGPWRAWTGE